ncbi:hypothetical protein A5673_15620 [Mycobacterium sp. E3198]|nr:hypothetical protein A5673_15620 [Mycobacterium sp. E3198]
MGEVWRAHDTVIDRTVAIKMLLPHFAQDRTFEQRFRREARAAARLDEPHVVPLYDVGEIDGRLYVAMRLINGQDLSTLLDDGPLGPERAVRIIEQIGSALQAAHQVGLVHRDVKPSNILITQDDFAYLIDFGIARAAGETAITSMGATIGTWSYMAPERFSGGEIEPSSDIYALACVLYQSLTGQPPFPGTTLEQVAMAHMTAPPPKPSARRHGIPMAMDDVIATGLAKDPRQRYSRPKDLAQAARRALNQAQADTIMADTKEAPTPARMQPPWRRPVFLAVFFAILLVASVGVVKAAMRRPQHDLAANSATTTAASAASPITFESMRDFVANYYADLPARPTDAWAKLDTHCQTQTGQREFLDFWASIQSVTLLSVSPRDTTSVVAKLKYVRRDGASDTEDRWLKMVSVNGVLLLDESGRVGSATASSTPPPQPLFLPKAIDQVLLTADQLSKLLGVPVSGDPAGGGAGGLAMNSSSYGTSDHSGQVRPPSCVGVAFTGEHDVYSKTELEAIKTQTFSQMYGPGMRGPELLQQTAAVFPSADQAQAFLASSQTQWEACSHETVGVTLGYENARGFTLGKVQNDGTLMTVSMGSPPGENGADACQQALGVRKNVVVEARTCQGPGPNATANPGYPGDPAWATADAERVAKAMWANVQP